MPLRYGSGHNCTFQVCILGRAKAFLAGDRSIDDTVFMDVDLGNGWMNGMEAARLLREQGSMAVLFFVTNMPQYAPDGYEVDAIDYCIKPINYSSLSVKLDKTVRALAQRTGIPGSGADQDRQVEEEGIPHVPQPIPGGLSA